MKFYAVQKGKKPGIYTSWPECQAQTNGFSGAVYKSFSSEAEAKAFLKADGYIDTSSSKPDVKKVEPGIDITKYDGPIAFVDGSYNADTHEYGYGVVIIEDTKNISEIHLNGKDNDPEMTTMRNVSGEILASMTAMEYALKHNFKTLTIFHDYEGIAKWCTTEWTANKNGTKEYVDFYEFIRKSIQIKFVHVKGHSNNYYNDMVDALAKDAIQIPLEKPAFADKIHPNQEV